MRLFVALDIDAEIRARIADFVCQLKPHAPSVRFVSDASYHVTLKFLGETEKLTAIRERLRTIEAPRFTLDFRSTGFFPTADRPRVFWAGIEAGPELARLAATVDVAVAPFGFQRETAPFRPHLTLARNGSGNPHNRHAPARPGGFQQLQHALASIEPPEFGTMTAQEFILYESRLAPSGAAYTKLERFALR